MKKPVRSIVLKKKVSSTRNLSDFHSTQWSLLFVTLVSGKFVSKADLILAFSLFSLGKQDKHEKNEKQEKKSGKKQRVQR